MGSGGIFSSIEITLLNSPFNSHKIFKKWAIATTQLKIPATTRERSSRKSKMLDMIDRSKKITHLMSIYITGIYFLFHSNLHPTSYVFTVIFLEDVLVLTMYMKNPCSTLKFFKKVEFCGNSWKKSLEPGSVLVLPSLLCYHSLKR